MEMLEVSKNGTGAAGPKKEDVDFIVSRVWYRCALGDEVVVMVVVVFGLSLGS
jgi:hypothetical protein